ncbi:MAG: hypothetical protein RLZZ366_806 [Pseudomonadota bacterium]|jgi:hypothetical protein
MHGAELSSETAMVSATIQRRWWHNMALVVFACINVASIGIFFAVFVGVVMSPPNPRNLLFLLVTGGFAFAVLVMGQFFYWSRLALRKIKERRP